MDLTESEWTGGPRTYRARKKRPCDACRRRKICCVRESETEPCSLCQMRSQQCTYITRPNVRRREPSQVQNERPPTQRTGNIRNRHFKRPDGVGAADTQTHQQESTIGTGDLPESWVSQFVGLSGDQDPYVLRHCVFRDDKYNSHSWSYVRVKSGGGETPAHFTMVPGSHLDAWPSWYPAHPSVNPQSEDHRKLIDAYISVVHASFPMLDIKSLGKEPSPTLTTLFGAVYTLSHNFASNLSDACRQDMKRWRDFLYQALPIEARHPCLETLEAWLCFIQRFPLIHRAPTTPGLWSEIGSLVGAAHDLGINVDPTDWEMDQSQKSRRIRIAWALFATDKWAALGLGRPSYISRDDWSVPMVTEDDFPNIETTSTAKMIFIALSKLSVILAEALHQFYTIRAQKKIKSMRVEDLLQLLSEFEERLNSFSQTVLEPLQALASSPSSTSGSLIDSTGTVELAHQTLEIVTYRAVLRHLPVEVSQPVRERARHSLARAVEFLRGLQVGRLRAYWWSPISRINFALIGSFMFSMRLTSVEETEVAYWTASIDQYRQLLDLHSVGFEITRLAALRLGLLTSVTEETEGNDEPDQLFEFELWDFAFDMGIC